MNLAGPDLVIAGAARCGTSTLAAALREHPAIDPGSSKEPNYFSRHYDEGARWYAAQFGPRVDGVFRMDASTSYTYPQFPQALDRLAADAPHALVCYVVREPIARAVSHFLLRRFTLHLEEQPTFGAALQADSYYTDVSDYRHWIGRLNELVGPDQLLVVPFAALTESSHEVAAAICRRLGLDPPPLSDDAVSAHRNAVVEFRAAGARRAVAVLRQSAVYPRVRSALGANRVRRLRSRLVKDADLPTMDEALSTCSAQQRSELSTLQSEVQSWVARYLTDQDARTGLEWASRWARD